MQRLYRFDLLRDRYRGPANAVVDGRDLSTNLPVTVCEWTPGEAALAAGGTVLADAAGAIPGVEFFSTESAFYIVADDDSRAAAALQDLRSRGLFTGAWPGLLAAAPPPPPPQYPVAASPDIADRGAPPDAQPARSQRKAGVITGLALTLVAGLVLVVALVLANRSDPPLSTSTSTNPSASLAAAPPASGTPGPTPLGPAQSGSSSLSPPPPEIHSPSTGGSREAVLAVLDRWRTTMLSSDVDAQTDCYAPVVELFFRRRNVDREQLRSMKRGGMQTWQHTDAYDLSDLEYSGDTGRPVLTFRKHWDSWDANRVKHFAGQAQERLTFASYDGAWKIVREEELTVYSVTKN